MLKINDISGKNQTIISPVPVKENKMHKSIKKNFLFLSNLLLFFALAAVIGACGGSGSSDEVPDMTGQATSLIISASKPTVPSDNSTNITITVTALDPSSAFVANVNIQMSTTTGFLGSSLITTNAQGKAEVTFESGPDPTNRTATITATSGTASAMIPIQIVGSTVTLEADGTSLTDDGSSTVKLTVTAKDSSGAVVSARAVNMTQSTGGGSVSFSPVSGTTNASGVFTTNVTGAVAGDVTVTASSLGATATTKLSVTAVLLTFVIDQLTLNSTILTDEQTTNKTSTAMKIGDTLNVRVYAPPGVTNVTFVTSIGEWDGGGQKVVTKAVAANHASADLTTMQTGVASVMAYNAAVPSTKDTLTVTMSSGADPAKIMLQAAPTIVPISVGSTVGSATITATVYDAFNNPLPGWPVAFSVVPGTGTSGGERISPVVVVTATALSDGDLSEGQARTSFTSGSMPSGGTGVQIRATVIGTSPSIETEPVGVNFTPSGNDVAIVIGGVAGSIAFGQATSISNDDTQANYVWPMSVLVADSNGNAVKDANVSLSLWPIAWSTGGPCSVDLDTDTTGTFYNEDINENLILDAGEDGRRVHFANNFDVGLGTQDTQITVSNSWGGTVPAIVTTNANGAAGFSLVYPKQSALWTMVRIRATTIVQGSETRGEIILRLTAMQNDVSPCHLGPSPYTF
jgi:hypothetical protein